MTVHIQLIESSLLADTERNVTAAYELLFRRAGVDAVDLNSLYTPEYEAANEAAIMCLTQAYLDADPDDDLNIPEMPDKFGVHVGDEVQSLLVLAFLRSPRLGEALYDLISAEDQK